MKNNSIIYLFLIGLFIGCNKTSELKETNEFTGLWSLHIMEQLNAETEEWSEWKNGMQGYILYDDTNNMSVHLTTKGYETTEIKFPNFTDTISTEALKSLTNSYVYFAKYRVDKEKGVVEHARISHSNPAEWNDIVQRKYTFNGDTLTLQPVEERTSNLRLKWVKSK